MVNRWGVGKGGVKNRIRIIIPICAEAALIPTRRSDSTARRNRGPQTVTMVCMSRSNIGTLESKWGRAGATRFESKETSTLAGVCETDQAAWVLLLLRHPPWQPSGSTGVTLRKVTAASPASSNALQCCGRQNFSFYRSRALRKHAYMQGQADDNHKRNKNVQPRPGRHDNER